jgi:hypothetical protein
VRGNRCRAVESGPPLSTALGLAGDQVLTCENGFFLISSAGLTYFGDGVDI